MLKLWRQDGHEDDDDDDRVEPVAIVVAAIVGWLFLPMLCGLLFRIGWESFMYGWRSLG